MLWIHQMTGLIFLFAEFKAGSLVVSKTDFEKRLFLNSVTNEVQ